MTKKEIQFGFQGGKNVRKGGSAAGAPKKLSQILKQQEKEMQD